MTNKYDRGEDASDTDWQPSISAEENPSSTDSATDAPPERSGGRKKRRRSRRRPAADPSGSDSDSSARPADSRAADEGEEGTSAPRRRRRGGRSRRRGEDRTDEAAAAGKPRERAEDTRREPTGSYDDRRDDDEPSSRPRRRGRGRRSSLAAGGDDDAAEAGSGDRSDGRDEPAEPSAAKQDGGRPRRRRGGRRRRGSTPRETEAENDRDEPAAQDREKRASGDAEGAPARRRRRGKRGGRKRTLADVEEGAVAIDGIPGEADLEDLELVTPEPPRSSSRKKKRGRKTEGRKRSRSSEDDDEDDDDDVVAGPRKSNVILVNASDPDETRVAVVEESRLVDFQMTVKNQASLVNNIYRGKVVNLEPAIGAAFIDFGQGRNGFLHTSDVLSCYGDDDWDLTKLLSTEVDVDEFSESSQPDVDAEISDGDDPPAESSKKKGKKAGKKAAGRGRHRARPRLPITELLGKGGSVVVQVTKDAIGDKGPTLTTYISIPGRHLVLMPSVARTGVSRKIEDEKERRRLKRILKGLSVPEGMGVIVRTAGIGATKAELKRDLEYLLLAWESFGKRLTLGRGPIALYEESDVALRVIRDLFTPETEKIVVDDQKVHERMVEFTKRLVPDAVERIELHDGARPLFHSFGVEQDFEKIFTRRVDLVSGGSIVFDQAEALVAIDVNSGKTRSDGFDFEDVALKTNLEAVPEIARQIRLRDLGGIVVVDFIDMMRMANRRAVERAFRQELSTDRARSKLGRISQFGLLEMTRQRLGAGMSKMLFANCPRCRGTGRARTVESRAVALLRRLGSALTLKGFTKVEVRAHPDTIEFLTRNFGGHVTALEREHDRKLVLTPVPDQLEDSVLRYLRGDGREVRPGGRRKR